MLEGLKRPQTCTPLSTYWVNDDFAQSNFVLKLVNLQQKKMGPSMRVCVYWMTSGTWFCWLIAGSLYKHRFVRNGDAFLCVH